MITYDKYEKISDFIMVIGNRVILKMNVSLSHYPKDNKRVSFHREIEYTSPKTNKNVINIQRQFDFYLSIEHIETKEFIRIGITDILKLRYGLNEAYKFFIDPKYENLYAKKDGELIILSRPNPITLTGLSMDKYLQFEPCIFTNFRGEAERGLRMFLSSTTTYCDISINRLEGFKYIIDSINLFEAAQIMLTYIQRPDYGYNLYSYNTEPEYEYNFEGKKDRKLTNVKENMSYFDKMKKLE